MIKKILALFVAFAFCSGASYIGNEQKYFFSSAALIEALQNNVNDEQKRADAATKYNELMNQQTGMVSIDNLFTICRAAGFNTYKKDGFNSCKQFINALIELDEDALSGFCPGLDAKGNNPNGLKSITDKTRIGDFCSSTNIYAGEVVFKKGYNCTCLSYACNDGYEFKGGACVTMIADGQGFCLRSDNKIQKDMSVEEAKAFCENLAIKNNCKYKSAVIKHKELRVLCNATNDEVDNAKQLMFENNEKIKANMKYFEVCDDDKGKSGGKEYCVKGVFNWVNIGQKEAIGLAQEYAKVKNGHNIICAEGYRTSWNDDYIKCATTDKKNFYEFQFDDVVESFDSDKSVGIIKGLAIIYGANSSNAQLTGNCDTTVNAKVVSSAKNYGLKSKTQNGMCRFYYDKLSEEKLATIDGLDNRIFYDDVQVQGSQQIEEYLKKYIRNQGITIKSFVCDKGYKKMDKAIMFGLKETDDILHCVLNGQPIDWVFDDLSELATERREAGHAGINCKISGGLYAGKKCHGLSKKQCDDMNAQLKRINPGSAGTIWQDEQCVLVDVQQQNYIENGIQIGLSVIALADCATTIVGNAQGVMGCTLAVVEITGLATELTTGNAMQNRAQEFLAQSIKCKEHSCALTTIKDLAPKVVSIQDALKSASTAKSVDEELARLIDLLEPEDLKSECAGDCDYKELISALGGDPNDASGTALKVANKVGFIAQFASLGASAFRLTGKAIARLGLKATKTIDTAGDVARAVSNTARAANTADDVSDAARFVTTATIGSADDMSDAARFVTTTTISATDDVSDVVKAANKADDVVDITKATNKVDDAADAVWDARAMRFRDPKTGRFMSGYTSWSDELADLGIKRTVVNGKEVYTDAKTGVALSDVQVLNRIPISTNDDWAKIGVRQIEHADGSVSFIDIRPGGGNKFISETEILKRIDNMSVSTTNAVDDMSDAVKATAISRADAKSLQDIAEREAKLPKGTKLSSTDIYERQRIYKLYGSSFGNSEKVEDAARAVMVTERTEKEITEAQKALAKAQDNLKYAREHPGNISRTELADRVRKVEELEKRLSDMGVPYTKMGDDVADVASGASRTVNKADDVATLRKTASSNFDTYLAEAKNSATGKSPHKIPKSRLNDAGWLEVNKSLAGENIQLVDTGDGYMQFVRADHLDDVADAARAANNTGKLFDVSAASKNFSGYVGRHKVFLEKLPTTSGGSSEVVNISGRAVVVVNIDGHRLPYYVSSGQAGKDALGIPSGKWYPVAGIGQKNGDWGWFNKMKDMNHNPVSAMDDIEKRLNQYFDAATLKNLALNSNDIPEASLDASRIINSEFPKGVVPYLDVVPGQQGVGHMPEQFRPLADENFQRVIDIFR